MKTEIEELRDAVKKGRDKMGYQLERDGGTSRLILEQELTFIESRQLEGYFWAAHQLVTELKKYENILIGPGWDWMISSHVCYTLGITNVSPSDINIEPILVWCDDNCNPTISIEVDEDSFSIVFQKAIRLYGFENVARMPVKTDGKHHLDFHDDIGYKNNGEEVYLHCCALLICPNGVANHFATDVVKDKDGNKILCTKDYIEECDNTRVFRFNILQSTSLSKIKGIQELKANNGKEVPKLYETSIWHEDYRLFYEGELNDIPLFDYNSIQEMTKIMMQMTTEEYGAFNNLLDIQGLFGLGEILNNKKAVAEYQQRHGIITILGKARFPWGLLYREDAAWFLHDCAGLSWKQTADVMMLADAKKKREAEKLKRFYLHQGMDNGFKKNELNRIWNTLFKKKTKKALPSKAHYAGRLYLSVFLARLKNEFPEEFNTKIGSEVLKRVYTLIDEKVTLQEEREKVKRCIMDVLNAPKGLISIDVDDVIHLFQEGGEIHVYDVSVDACKENRMTLLKAQLMRNSKHFEPYDYALVFFFFPENQPLLMEELQPFSEWFESVPNDYEMVWGMAPQSTLELRAIVLLQ